ncbi:hypothetical protein J2T14_000529 [Paenibacillus harenae]|nr:hypothetical protein [Paenibacillus harenae]
MPSSTALFVLFHICGAPSIFLKDHSVIDAGLALYVKGLAGYIITRGHEFNNESLEKEISQTYSRSA